MRAEDTKVIVARINRDLSLVRGTVVATMAELQEVKRQHAAQMKLAERDCAVQIENLSNLVEYLEGELAKASWIDEVHCCE